MEMLTTGQAARLLEMSPERLRQLVRDGKVTPAQETPLGALFTRAQIEDLAAERRAAKEALA